MTTHAVLLFALGAVLRLTYIAIFRPSFDSVYWSLSSGLLDTGSLSVDGIRVTDFEPGYPMFLAGTRLLLGHHPLIVQVWAGRRCFGGCRLHLPPWLCSHRS